MAIKVACGGMLLASATFAEEVLIGDPLAGRKLAGICRTCHGIDGYAQIPIAPHIGGEPASYLIAQLTAFRDGQRQHEMMSLVSQGLSDQQIADVASWYASHRARTGEVAGDGDAVASCVACHGANGISTVENAPNLAGETNIYIETQLKSYRSGKRQHEIMSPIAAKLSDENIREIANWFAGITLEIMPPE